MRRYIKPEVEIVEVSVESLMAASPLGSNDSLPTIDSADNMFSKEHKCDVWGFDDEDED